MAIQSTVISILPYKYTFKNNMTGRNAKILVSPLLTNDIAVFSEHDIQKVDQYFK